MHELTLPLIAVALAAVFVVGRRLLPKPGSDSALLIRTLWPLLAGIFIALALMSFEAFHRGVPEWVIGIILILVATTVPSFSRVLGHPLLAEYQERVENNPNLSSEEKFRWIAAFRTWSIFAMLAYWQRYKNG